MLISDKGKKFLTGRRISYRLCLWAWPGSNIFKNFFNKKLLDLSLEYSFNSAGHSENFDFFSIPVYVRVSTKVLRSESWNQSHCKVFYRKYCSYLPIGIFTMQRLLRKSILSYIGCIDQKCNSFHSHKNSKHMHF